VLEFDVSVDADGTARNGPGGGAFPAIEGWLAEHLVLAGLVRCMLASLAHAAKRAQLDVEARGSAHGTITKREDGLYGFVEIEARYEVDLSPSPPAEALAELLERAERGCFVGNSLATRPSYRWTVNGVGVE
jgi:uncharacterized OsmC-like protein